MSTTFTIFGASVLAVLLAGYLAQKYLPPPKPAIIGIDLGTTFSCVGVYYAVSGNVSVIADHMGKKCIPSIVAFTQDGVLVGFEALAQAEHNPKNTFYDAKRFIGKRFTKGELREEAHSYPFRIAMGSDSMARFYRNTSATDDHNADAITPEEIGSHILGKLKKTAENNLTRQIDRAVITVPAEFDDLQRNYTKIAAKLAGLEVVRIINEPTAAAMAYGLHQREGMRTVLVVDFGGGTLDVALLNVQGGMFLTQAMAGNNHLGGQDINQNLLTYFLQHINNKYKRELVDPEDLQVLREEVERVKLYLTFHEQAEVKVVLPSMAAKFLFTLTRLEFDDINTGVFSRVLEPVIRVLEDAEYRKSDIDEIVLVGGSTRIPKVREIIRNFFRKEPNVSIDPDLAVTHGVAIQAGILGGMWPLSVSAVERPVRVRKTKF